MRVTVNFQLKKQKARSDGKCPVYVRCIMNGNRFELSTGIFLSNNYWDNLKQQVAGRSEESRIFNNRLEKISSNIHDHYNQLESKGEPLTSSSFFITFSGLINSFLSFFIYFSLELKFETCFLYHFKSENT